MVTPPPIDPELAGYLAQYTAGWQGDATWAGGAMRLRVTAYASDYLPPLRYVTSVRGVVFRGDDVLVLTNQHTAHHVVPGGRREEGETPTQTLAREVLEEAGWVIAPDPKLAAVTHLRHLTPKPPDYRFLYPDFLWTIYAAEAIEHQPAARLTDDYEQAATFRPIVEAFDMGLSEENLFYLRSALSRRR